MSNVRSTGEATHEEPVIAGVEAEVRGRGRGRGRGTEVAKWVWQCPQTVGHREMEEAERWDGLS